MTTPNLLVVAGMFIAAVATPSDAGRQVTSEDRLGAPQAAADRTLATVVLAQDQTAAILPATYFPLASGNSWVYRGGGIWAGTNLTLEIGKTQVSADRHYFLLHGLPSGDYWLRQDAKGSIYAGDPNQAADKLWWFFQSPLGVEYQTFLPGALGCEAAVTSRNLHYQGPVGTFDNALEIDYVCPSQAGMEREVFLPGIGLVLRRQATGGPSYGTWELIYASVGGLTVASAPDFGFGLALDNSIYTVDAMPPQPLPLTAPVMTARISLRNNTQPISLTFPTGQMFDFTIKNEKGVIVYRWSDGKAFTQVVHTETFGPGERNFVIQVSLAGPDKKPLPAGKYVADGWLTTMQTTPATAVTTTIGTPPFGASAGFEIRWVY